MDSPVTWDDKYNTGNYVIDYQHKRLVRLMDELDEIRQHEELRPFLLQTVFDEITNYTDYHFKTEEKMMIDARYSDFDGHQKLHQHFIHKLNFFKNKFAQGSKCIDLEFCSYLKEWLVDHIGNEDPKFISEMFTGRGLV